MNYTDITVLLDRSGSMKEIKLAMESGFAEFLQQHQMVPSSRLTLVQFDTQNPFEVVYQNKAIGEASPLKIEPRGGTPLLDAICYAVDNTGSRLAETPEASRPDRVLFVTITDGAENSSQQYNRDDVKTRVTLQTNVYKWNFLYLGANQDAFAEAASFGIPKGHVMSYKSSGIGTRAALQNMAVNSLAYVRGATVVPDFNEDQLAAALQSDPAAPVATARSGN